MTSTSPNLWPRASDVLARRVQVRARKSALFSGIGPAVCVAGVAAIVVRLAGGSHHIVPIFLLAGLAIGVVFGLRRMRRTLRVEAGDAAWALDRMADRGEHGLAAALTRSEATAHAAASTASTPPKVRLLPPRGLAWLAAGVLAAGVAWMAPTRTPNPDGVGAAHADATQSNANGSSGAGAADADANADARLQAMRRVREALALPETGALPPELLAERVRDPAARERAHTAAGTSAVAHVLRADGSDPEQIAQSLIEADTTAQNDAAARRRREAQSAARDANDLIPAHRREVVQRYLELLTK